MTRQEHLEWCKKRANEYLDRGDIANGIASMISDMNKHEETKIDNGSILAQLGLRAAMSDDINEAKRYVNGFN